jgi:hypothetical protein
MLKSSQNLSKFQVTTVRIPKSEVDHPTYIHRSLIKQAIDQP